MAYQITMAHIHCYLAYGLRAIFLFLFPSVSLVKAICKSDPNLLCCSDSVWDNRIGHCIDCSDGYSGINCSDFCRYPSYGKSCQLLCTCAAEFCNPSTGCMIQTSFGVDLQSYETTTGQAKVLTIPTTTITVTSSDEDVVSRSSNRAPSTHTDPKATSQSHTPEPEQDISLDDKDDINVLLLSGIFGFCGIFVILFSLLIIIQAKYKCRKIGQDVTYSNRNHFSSTQIKGIYTKYNEETDDAAIGSNYQQPTSASSDLESPPGDNLERYQKEGLLDSVTVSQQPVPCCSSKRELHFTGNEEKMFPEYIEVIEISDDHENKQCFTSCESSETAQSVCNEEADVYLTVFS